MRYKNFKAVAMRYKNNGKPKARVTKIALLRNKVLDYVSVSVGARTWLLVLLFRLHKFFLQMITNFSKRRKLHFLLTLV